MSDRFTALVMRSTGSWYEVRGVGDDRNVDGELSGDGEILKARVRGRLRLSGSRSTNPVVVGDRVECIMEGSGEVWIEKILPRDNYIIRRSSNLSRESHIIAANLYQALVVATLFSPATAPEFIDRFLVTCEAYRIPAVIVLNKIDLVRAAEGGDEVVRDFVAVYKSAGYQVMLTSAATGEGIEELREFLRGRTTLISGNSGVGKSTLVKAISPGLDIRTGEVSRAHGKGMHTTTFSQMYGLDGGGYVIDSPGIKGFGLVDISGGELYHYFPDLMRVAPECQYYNCTHTHEPGCAVVRAVEGGEISEQRYVSYLKMLEEDEKYR
jgi:ribosome biogenesis GTPase